MTYQETLDYMYSQLPMFQRVGNVAFKKDLTNTIAFCEHMGNPHQKFKSIHVAGTNGKGSSSHMISAILQKAGYKVGLYTSPHLRSFTERIRINGKPIPEDKVVDFIASNKSAIESIAPSFFEMTVAMAFDHFAKEQVDYAVVEVGLGGRLDSTNILQPEVGLITNIGWDHMDMLGDKLELIAFEKGGIIKDKTPIVISQKQEDVEDVFNEIASKKEAPIYFASLHWSWQGMDLMKDGKLFLNNVEFGLEGSYQKPNALGVLQVIDIMNEKENVNITKEHIKEGLKEVVSLTGMMGRWQTLSTDPWIICDVGHNEDGLKFILDQLKQTTYNQLHFVLGVVKEKDLGKMLPKLPQDAQYYYCRPDVPRGLDVHILENEAKKLGMKGSAFDSVNDALNTAKENAQSGDLIFVGGSTFVVAEVV